MLLVSVGIAFVLLFGVLIVDGISTGYAATSGNRTDVTTRPRKSAESTTATAAVDRSRTFGDRRPVDGTGLAA